MVNVNKSIINPSMKNIDSVVNQSARLIDNIKTITNIYYNLNYYYHHTWSKDPIDQFISSIKKYKDPCEKGVSFDGGCYGEVFKFNEFVIKSLHHTDSLSKPWSDSHRTSRVLNSINGSDYSRAYKLDSGEMVLVSKYVNGTNVSKKEALDFINSKGLSIHDAHREGNVIRDKENRLFLIDASTVVQTPLKRKNSLASDEFYKRFPDKLT
ncbi:hypothetical protein HB976_18715 [Yersinia mollaretii]|uniref:hypothetical protein n=1 Tax=Yersinia mollaretii TaxID=33060 RepID=UPI001427E51D|nr:hypothetical protein [Yersinia mollaretii]MDA5536980.1 hypothetical protein [Yersinia mollaretii]NIL04974.1 hypothetical protein [Yersinia mollaretii]